MSTIRPGTCAEPGPYAAHCTDHPGHRYSCYDGSEDVSFNEGHMADTDAYHSCDDPSCPDKAEVSQLRGQRLHLWCPGCDDLHVVNVGLDANDHPLWTWNGNHDAPTVEPSILVTYQYGADLEPRRCHSFLRAGRWEFLADSTHVDAGKTLDAKPLPLWVVREGRR